MDNDDTAPMQSALAVRALLPTFRAAISSDSAPGFRVLRSFPRGDDEPKTNSSNDGKTVCVLDSSFNPPTKAHMHLALRALRHYTTPTQTPSLLLLLATANADKKAVPAAPEQRVAMMCLLADELRSNAATVDNRPACHVDVGVTTSARFIDKCADLQTNGYAGSRLVWIMGFDTLIRLLDTKYYPPEHTLAPVHDTLLAGSNRILAFGRPGDTFGDTVTQQAYYSAVDGKVAERLDVLEADESTAGISSSAVRGAVARGEAVDGGVCESIAAFIRTEGLYL
ncbi:hypothetical protein TWF696_000071 [Orbilia brochopaga]|uniref:Cytidyltransferase-like domain-containing protein n=1 Tax=Orbilia brochopaga TaxID=3140254 RepID=A0AAV9VA70_9PEZI